jgi:hypothetical protein
LNGTHSAIFRYRTWDFFDTLRELGMSYDTEKSNMKHKPTTYEIGSFTPDAPKSRPKVQFWQW